MKKGIIIVTAATLGLATAAWAGQGMGSGNCGNCGGQGQGMQQGQDNCGGQGQGMQRGRGHGMGMQNGPHGKMSAGHGKNRHGARAPMMKKVMSQLDLTDAQKEQIRQIMRESRQQMKGMKGQKGMGAQAGPGQGKMGKGKMHGQGQGKHAGKRGHLGLDASQFMSKESFDKAAFKKSLQEKWKKQDELRQQRRAVRLERMADRMEKIFKVLTPEQREKLIELSKNNGKAAAGK